MLRQQQAEIEALKYEKSSGVYDNEPVAWMDDLSFFTKKPEDMEGVIPLYTHPAQELNDGGEPVKNVTYWKRQYNEMSALNDRLKSSLYHANEQIKYLEFHPAKTLTMTFEEMYPIAEKHLGHAIGLYNWKIFGDAILRKASEK